MTSKTTRIVNDLGLHLRAAGVVVREAGRFTAEIWITHGDARANAKSIMSVLTLAAAKGVEVTVSADGPDAEAAIDAIVALIDNGFVT